MVHMHCQLISFTYNALILTLFTPFHIDTDYNVFYNVIVN